MNRNEQIQWVGDIPFKIRIRNVKQARIDFLPSGPVLTAPILSNPSEILKKYKHVIDAKWHKTKMKVAQSRKLDLVSREKEDFLKLIREALDHYGRILGVIHAEIKFRKMKRRWGSCRSNGIITFNKTLIFLPAHLIRFVVYHELAHLRVPGHNKKFKQLIAKEFPRMKELDRELDLYGLRLGEEQLHVRI